jgi:hypothetical protein
MRHADVERLDLDVGGASSGEQPRKPARVRVELRLGDERAAPLDADHLAVVLEYRERLAHYDAAHAEASGQAPAPTAAPLRAASDPTRSAP